MRHADIIQILIRRGNQRNVYKHTGPFQTRLEILYRYVKNPERNRHI